MQTESSTPPAPPRFPLVIFDLDGTLADTLETMVEILDGVADRFGFDRIKREELDTLRGQDALHVMKHLRVPFWKLPVIGAHMQSQLFQHLDRVRTFPGVVEMLRALSARGIRLAIVSSNSWQNTSHILGEESAALFHDHDCGVAVLGKAIRLRKVIRRNGFIPSQAIYIGDEIRDLAAAKRAGVTAGAVSWGFTHTEALLAHQPDMLFANPAAIVETLAG
jgi:phosphoglycolate phosphatase